MYRKMRNMIDDILISKVISGYMIIKKKPILPITYC